MGVKPMKQYLIAALAVCSILIAFQGTASAQRNEGPCSRWRHHHGGVVKDVKACTRHAIKRWHVPGGPKAAFHVEFCESSFRVHVSTGQYDGVFQIGDHEWNTWNRPQRYRRWFHGRPSVFNGAANIITGIFHAAHTGWGAWSCAP